jgi:nickel transport protein
MKALTRWSAILSFAVGGALCIPALNGNLSALALTEEQVVQKLRTVPVFTISVQQNNQQIPLPLTYEVNKPAATGTTNTPATTEKVPGIRFFYSQVDAQAFLADLKKKNPSLPNTAKILPVPLSRVYQQIQETRKKNISLVIDLEPSKQQVEAAAALMRQQGQPVDQSKIGTPLFLALGGKDKVPMRIKQDNQEVIPLFFNKQELQSVVDQLKKDKPAEAATIEIVPFLSLETIIYGWTNSSDAEFDKQVPFFKEMAPLLVLVPSQDALDYARSVLPQQGAAPSGQQQQRPAGSGASQLTPAKK